MNIRLGTARTVLVGPVLDSDGVAKTDLAVAAILASKNGGNPAALDGSATLTHKQTGHYLLALTANDVSALGCMELSINSTTDAMPIVRLNVLTVTAWDALHAASGGYVPADMTHIHGTALTETATQLAGAFTKFFDVAAPTVTVNSLADAIWDEPIARHNSKNTTGYLLRNASGGTAVTILSGTAQTGSVNTVTLSADASTTNDVYTGNIITLTGGTGVGQTRKIIAYAGDTKIATVDLDWIINPDNTSTFDVTAFAGSVISDEGVAQAGANQAITFATTASAYDDIYNGSFVTITSGTGAGQTRTITDYDGTSKVADVDSVWSTNPDVTSGYAVTPAGASDSTAGSDTGPTAIEIADALLSRDISNVEDTASEYSICTIILSTLESSITDTTWTIRKTGGATYLTKTVTIDSNADPITGVT